MGCSSSLLSKKKKQSPVKEINQKMFIVNGLIGEGGFGRVMTGLFIKNNQWYAVKEVKKVSKAPNKSSFLNFIIHYHH